ncbi:hypothetical protein FKP32DRAFT_41001 [Trametes sanguinea]|nr:hypothetical protein FKP32DRAFT_41001 [Trametes sanguinea]
MPYRVRSASLWGSDSSTCINRALLRSARVYSISDLLHSSSLTSTPISASSRHACCSPSTHSDRRCIPSYACGRSLVVAVHCLSVSIVIRPNTTTVVCVLSLLTEKPERFPHCTRTARASNPASASPLDGPLSRSSHTAREGAAQVNPYRTRAHQTKEPPSGKFPDSSSMHLHSSASNLLPRATTGREQRNGATATWPKAPRVCGRLLS